MRRARQRTNINGAGRNRAENLPRAGRSDMPVVYIGMYLLQQMTIALMSSWWLAPLVSKEVKGQSSPPLSF